MSNMCWCKDCKWFYKEHCSNRESDNCTENMGGHNSCEHSKLKEGLPGERNKSYEAGFLEGYDKANQRQMKRIKERMKTRAEKENDNE